MTCPTERLRLPARKAPRELAARRNALLRQMVADSRGGGASLMDGGGEAAAVGGAPGGRPLMLLDIDAMTQQLPAAATISLEDHHYQVWGHAGICDWAGVPPRLSCTHTGGRSAVAQPRPAQLMQCYLASTSRYQSARQRQSGDTLVPYAPCDAAASPASTLVRPHPPPPCRRLAGVGGRRRQPGAVVPATPL